MKKINIRVQKLQDRIRASVKNILKESSDDYARSYGYFVDSENEDIEVNAWYTVQNNLTTEQIVDYIPKYFGKDLMDFIKNILKDYKDLGTVKVDSSALNAKDAQLYKHLYEVFFYPQEDEYDDDNYDDGFDYDPVKVYASTKEEAKMLAVKYKSEIDGRKAGPNYTYVKNRAYKRYFETVWRASIID